jgi:NADH:ubiquinone oxidoreductase subunit 5 (subunit L)/multisubunit Na+/H+ antiporter MnhA subunit
MGLISAALGILFALAQHDLKRLLAYSSVENIGIIFIGMGMGVLGVCRGSQVLATMGFCGALLHVLNHSMAKGMLFLNAGALLHATGTRRLDLLGGLSKKLPLESVLFLIGSVTLCALPPLSGFLSEFWIYMGAFGMRNTPGPGMVMSSLVLLASLALVGGLAAVAFSKAFGSAYLGHPRQAVDENFHRPGWAMRIPMMILTALCLAMAPLFPWIAGLTAPMVAQLSGFEARDILGQISVVKNSLWPLLIFAGSLIVLAGILVGVRWALLRRRKTGESGTWDCGYAGPSPRMQYSGTSYSQPVVNFFSLILQGRKIGGGPDGFFPRAASQSTLIPDLYLEKIYRPFFLWIESRLARWRWIQHGRIQAYILYIFVTLLVILAWKLR